MRYILQKSVQPNYWVCTDTLFKIVCIFENKNFNENQKFEILEDFDAANYMQLAEIAREMADWLRANHYNKVL